MTPCQIQKLKDAYDEWAVSQADLQAARAQQSDIIAIVAEELKDSGYSKSDISWMFKTRYNDSLAKFEDTNEQRQALYTAVF